MSRPWSSQLSLHIPVMWNSPLKKQSSWSMDCCDQQKWATLIKLKLVCLWFTCLPPLTGIASALVLTLVSRPLIHSFIQSVTRSPPGHSLCWSYWIYWIFPNIAGFSWVGSMFYLWSHLQPETEGGPDKPWSHRGTLLPPRSWMKASREEVHLRTLYVASSGSSLAQWAVSQGLAGLVAWASHWYPTSISS
jgi:hypothetical protein